MTKNQTTRNEHMQIEQMGVASEARQHILC